MSQFTTNLFNVICDPNWIAKTYSEYLMTCAKSQFDLVSSISEAISNDTVDDLIDQKSDEYQEMISEINAHFAEYLLNYWDGPLDVNIINIREVYEDENYPDRGSILSYCEEFFVIDDPDEGQTASADCMRLIDFAPYWRRYYHPTSPSIHGRFETYKILRDFLTGAKDDVIYSIQSIKSAISSLASGICTNFDVHSDSTITLNEGYVNVGDLLNHLIEASYFPNKDNFSLSALNSQSESINDVELNFQSVLEQLKNNAASAVSWSIGFEACTKGSVSDMVNYFDSQIKNYFSDLSGQINSTIQTVRSNVSRVKDGARDFVSMANDFFGFDQLHSESATVQETSAFNYTGASPLPAVDWHTLEGAGELVGKLVVAAGYGIWTAIKKGVEKIWPKIRPYVMAVTENPEDIVVSDNSANSYTAEGMSYQAVNDWVDVKVKSEAIRDQMVTLWQSRLNTWYAYKTLFSEIVLKVTEVWAVGTDVVRIKFTAQFKPRCVNPKTAVDAGVVEWYNGHWDGCYGKLASENSFANFANSNALYVDDNDDESIKYAGFQTGMAATCSAWYSALFDIAYNNPLNMPITSVSGGAFADQAVFGVDGTTIAGNSIYKVGVGNKYHTTLNPPVHTVDGYYKPTNPSNKDFFELLSGYDGSYASSGILDNYEYVFYKHPYGYDETRSGSSSSFLGAMLAPLLGLMTLQWYDKDEDPSDYMYLPYSTDNYIFEDPRYRIKTDSDNQNIATTITTVLVTITVIILAVVIGKTISKIIKMKKYAKAKAFVGQMDNAIWNGKRMTMKETWKYRRRLNKIGKLESCSSGLANAMSSSDSICDKLQSFMSNSDIQMKNLLMPNNSIAASYDENSSFYPADNLIPDDQKFRSILYSIVTGRNY